MRISDWSSDVCSSDLFLAGLDHRAFDEQPVDAAWVLDRVGETAAGFEIERERAGAEMDVEIEQRGRALTALAEQPGERGRDRRGTDPAARAHHRGPALRPFARRFPPQPKRGRSGIGVSVRLELGGPRLHNKT